MKMMVIEVLFNLFQATGHDIVLDHEVKRLFKGFFKLNLGGGFLGY